MPEPVTAKVSGNTVCSRVLELKLHKARRGGDTEVLVEVPCCDQALLGEKVTDCLPCLIRVDVWTHFPYQRGES